MHNLLKRFARNHHHPGDENSADRRITLQIGIASLISMLLIILGGSITWYTYENQKTNVLNSTGEIFQRSASQASQDMLMLVKPVDDFIGLATRLENIGTREREQRLELLPFFVQALRDTRWLANVAVGYPNGDFLVVWALRGDEFLVRQTGAPGGAAFFVKLVNRDPGLSPVKHHLYYDDDLNLISREDQLYTDYDPRVRPWYRGALDKGYRTRTAPYRFVSTGQTGITIAQELPDKNGVVAADVVIDSLTDKLLEYRLTRSTEVMVFDHDGTVLAYSDRDAMQQMQTRLTEEHVRIGDFEQSVIPTLFTETKPDQLGEARIISTAQGRWLSVLTELTDRPGRHAYLAIVSPLHELTAEARTMAQRNLLIVVVIILLAILVGLVFSRRITESLEILDQQAKRIREFSFDTPLQVETRIKEVNDLGRTMSVMKSAIQRFIEVSRTLSAEKKIERALELVLQDAMTITSADGGAIALVSDDQQKLEYALLRNDETGLHLGGASKSKVDSEPLDISPANHQPEWAELQVIHTRSTLSVAHMEKHRGLDFSNIIELYRAGEYRCQSLLIVPLMNRQLEVIGILQLVNARDRNSGAITGFAPAYQAYVEAISSNAALALDNNRLLRAQKNLFDAFVQLIAHAIDTKSAYTGGHCQRVPVLAGMLAEAASESPDSRFKDFKLSEDENYQLYISSWLHDCGKVTTPEYIVDKATKLETIYNRLHEIRMRFEVLWRDAEIAYRDGLIVHPGNKTQLRAELDKRQQQLQDDFVFVASCNIGNEFMTPEDQERIRVLANQTWERHFDDRIGLSEEEFQLRQKTPAPPLPVVEQLLADKPEHRVPRTDGGNPFGSNQHGFDMEVPENALNLGEINNLCISRGTLTEEDRFKINDHIIQTINMLQTLPFPKELRQVPEWAGNHHEKLDGTGYPRKLKAEDLSIPERVMGIADIFEALTAADRPYKKAKNLSESIRILGSMRDNGHVCPDLFELFLTSGVYRRYAEEHLQPEQLDEVNIEDYLQHQER